MTARDRVSAVVRRAWCRSRTGLLAGLLLAVTLPVGAWRAESGAAGRREQAPSAPPPYHVTHLFDAGPGSLRDAVSQGNRTVVFDVAGDIELRSDLRVLGSSVTVDGFSAPAPGITLRNFGVLVFGVDGVVLRGLRVRNSDQRACDRRAVCRDARGLGVGILVSFGASNVVIDHVSIAHSGNSAMGVVKGAHDVTVSNSVLLENRNVVMPRYNLLMLISGAQRAGDGQRTRRVTLHHNLLMEGNARMPQVKWSDRGEQAPELTVDMRNNVVINWHGSGTQVWKGARANIVNNYYDTSVPGRQARAIVFCGERAPSDGCDGMPRADVAARAYIAGNVSGAGTDLSGYLNQLGTEAEPFPAPVAVETTDACSAARRVLESAGVRPLDPIDQHYLSLVSLRACAD
jgi:hypothetical protein